MMGKIHYLQIREDIVAHAKLQVMADSKHDVYSITSDYSTMVKVIGKKPVAVLVKFLGFVSKEDESETSYGFTRDARYEVVFSAKALNDDAVDELLTKAITDFEWYLCDHAPGYVFGSPLIEWAKVQSSHIAKSKSAGLIGWLVLTVRISEDT